MRHFVNNQFKKWIDFERKKDEIDRDLVRSNLDEELEIDIVRLGRGALGLLAPATGDEIDTLRRR